MSRVLFTLAAQSEVCKARQESDGIFEIGTDKDEKTTEKMKTDLCKYPDSNQTRGWFDICLSQVLYKAQRNGRMETIVKIQIKVQTQQNAPQLLQIYSTVYNI